MRKKINPRKNKPIKLTDRGIYENLTGPVETNQFGLQMGVEALYLKGCGVYMDLERAITELQMKFDNLMKQNFPLSGLNTFGTGGSARLYAEVKTAEGLAAVVKEAASLKVPFFMLGGGSNVLISDRGYEGLIIKNAIKGFEVQGDYIMCGAGEDLQDLIDFATEQGLTGLEFASGIYGTVGGAIYGNAGAYGSEIRNVMVSADLVDREGNIRTEENGYFEFNYRTSKLKQTHEFVTRARFALKKGDKKAIKSKVEEIIAIRKEKLPLDKPSAGCFFKNIPDKTQEFGKLSAGKLLEQVGAKEASCGRAAVFNRHANILINNGSATSSEIRRLSQELKKRVKVKFGIDLQEEVILLGEFEEDNISSDI